MLLCNAGQTNLSVFRQSTMHPIIPIGSHPLSLPATPATATVLHPKPVLPSQFMFLTYKGYKRIALGQLITPALSAQPAASVADDAIAHALAPERDRMALQIIVNQVGEQLIVFDTWSTSALKKNETSPDLTVKLYANGNNQATGCEINHRGHDSDPLFSGSFTHVRPANMPRTKPLSSLEALPPELQAMIIACIPYASSTLASLGGVSQDMNDVVASKLGVSRLLRRADGIRRCAEPVRDFHAILKESKDISQTHRTAVLMALARNIQWLPHDKMRDAFTDGLALADTLPWAGRGTALAALVKSIGALPDPQSRAEAFADVLKAADTDILPEADKTTVLNALAHKINDFHDLESEILAFTKVLKAADTLQGADKASILNALAGTIYWFPDFPKLKAFTDLRNAAAPLSRADKAAVLTTLAAKIDWFTDPQSSLAAFTDVLAATHILQRADKAAVVAALATNLHTLPNDKIVDAFADVLAVADTLQGADKARVLTALAYKLNHFHAVQPEVEAITDVRNAADTLQGADKTAVLDALDAVRLYDE